MTKEQAKAYLPFIQAVADGKVVQWKSRLTGQWSDCDNHYSVTGSPPEELRIKPTSQLRPWKPEEVPVGALLKTKHKDYLNCVILGVFQNKVVLNTNPPSGSYYINDLLTYHGGHNGDSVLHSIDNGKTWKPCGVVE